MSAEAADVTLLLGTQFYAGGQDAGRRQVAAAEAMLALRGVEAVNVQWRDESFEQPGVETLPVLVSDSRTLAGATGPRKPILSEIFDALAREAGRRGLRRFAFINSDIVVLQAAVDAIAREDKQTYAFSRTDFRLDTGADVRIVTTGLDMFVMDAEWWRAHRHRFRPYVLGEWFYDCVFGAILMTFGDGVILNRGGEIRHEMHAHGFGDMENPSAVFNGYLAALDSRLFTLWARYHDHLEALRARGADAAEERALIGQDFVWRQSPGAALWHAGRSVRARWRYRRDRARVIARATAAPR